MIFIQIRERSGKHCLVQISMSLTLCMVALRKVALQFVASNCELYYFAQCYTARVCAFPSNYASFSIPVFVNKVEPR